MVSQNQVILEHLRRRPITRAEAYELYGITELNTRICNLRADGHIISSMLKKGVNRFGRKVNFCEYTLVKEVDKSKGDKNGEE